MKKEDHPKGFYPWLKRFMDKKEPDKRRNYRYILILGCVGILLMVLNQMVTGQQEPELAQSTIPTFQADEKDEETEVFKSLFLRLSWAVAGDEIDKLLAKTEMDNRYAGIDFRNRASEHAFRKLLRYGLIAHIQHDVIESHRDKFHCASPCPR